VLDEKIASPLTNGAARRTMPKTMRKMRSILPRFAVMLLSPMKDIFYIPLKDSIFGDIVTNRENSFRCDGLPAVPDESDQAGLRDRGFAQPNHAAGIPEAGGKSLRGLSQVRQKVFGVWL
jgi:hypothetical protein